MIRILVDEQKIDERWIIGITTYGWNKRLPEHTNNINRAFASWPC